MRSRVVIVTTLFLILIATPALAKGPSSATITGPGIGEPMELVDGDHIAELMARTGLWHAISPTDVIEAPPIGSRLGPAYTLTWVNMGPPHLSEAARSIRQIIYPHADMGPLIHTPNQPSLQGWGPEVIGWQLATPDLVDTLRHLGVPLDGAETTTSSSLPTPLIFGGVAFVLFAAFRFVNSRLRPVVFNR